MPLYLEDMIPLQKEICCIQFAICELEKEMSGILQAIQDLNERLDALGKQRIQRKVKKPSPSADEKLTDGTAESEPFETELTDG
jgi:hypothetical protein